VTAERLSGEEVIGLGRAMLERLVAQQRERIAHLTTSAWHVYTITGSRIH
jgi:hypothetical protein